MVSSSHEAMHRIFQDHPGLFSGVSKVLGIDFAPPTSVTVLPNDLTETSPVERRVDTLVRLDTEGDEPLLLAIEAQSNKAPDKPASWAYYVSYLLTKYRLQPMLLVVCQDRATAEWAARPVDFGPPQWPLLTLRPLVAGPHNMPVITDPAEVRKDLALATLSAITHARNPDVGAILKAMTTVLRDTPQAIADPIIELIAQGLGKRPAAELWRNLVAVDLSFYKSYIAEEIRDEGRAEGRAEDILRLLDRRGIDVSNDDRERITSCDDLDVLGRWFDRAITAASTTEVFAD
ncbi:hypothetical protein SAMN04487981_102283 [Streptomyces sp. cf386]|uniref:hypothetical protein n=1 Tax=Streptomyces sp. cf386 TaxID=1761904 RepID=UPI000882EEB2|nr:hypothetical protein [Streptomyces sp. cf386]SDM69381.1 hypothetical protein SAMN04487981_102283 [Streptomyces sp. cf386]